MKAKLQTVGYGVLGLLAMVAVGFIIAAFVKGAEWLGEVALPFLPNIFWICVALVLFILLPLLIFKKTRIVGGGGLYIISYLFGLTLWIYSFIYAYALWGIAGVVVGFFIIGVGVVPVALLATMINGYWFVVLEIVVMGFCVFGTRALGTYILSKHDEAMAEKEHEKSREIVLADYARRLAIRLGYSDYASMEERCMAIKNAVVHGENSFEQRLQAFAEAHGYQGFEALYDMTMEQLNKDELAASKQEVAAQPSE
jgi:signal transduction histidine kinase